MANEEEDPAVRTTDEVLSDLAAHGSADLSQDIHIQLTPPAASPAHPQREKGKEEAKVVKKEVSWNAVLSEDEDGAILTDFESDISGLLSDGEYIPSNDRERRREGADMLAGLSPKGVVKEKGVVVDPVKGSKGKGKLSPSRQPGLVPQGGAGGVASPVKTDPVVTSKGKGRLSPLRGVARGVVTPVSKVVPAALNYSDFDSETDSEK